MHLSCSLGYMCMNAVGEDLAHLLDLVENMGKQYYGYIFYSVLLDGNINFQNWNETWKRYVALFFSVHFIFVLSCPGDFVFVFFLLFFWRVGEFDILKPY